MSKDGPLLDTNNNLEPHVVWRRVAKYQWKMQLKAGPISICIAMALSIAQCGTAFAETLWPPETKPAQINITTDSSPGWLPSQAQIAELHKTTEDFLAAKDSGRAADAYALLADINREQQPFQSFAETIFRFNRQAGAATERRVVKVTWTKDPAQAPVAGVYAALDIVGQFANIDRYCGYLVLYQAPSGGAFHVMREEINFLDNAAAARITRQSSAAAVEDVWAKVAVNCPGYQPATAAVRQSEMVPEVTGSTIGYPTVDAALAALHAKGGVVFTTVAGWTVANDKEQNTVWSFPPPGHPAYPAAVKRQVVQRNGAAYIDMSVICGATKQACDDLVRSFQQLNAQMAASMRGHQ